MVKVFYRIKGNVYEYINAGKVISGRSDDGKIMVVLKNITTGEIVILSYFDFESFAKPVVSND